MGSGTAVSTGDVITAAKMNLKLETLVDADITHDSGDWTVGEDGAGQDIIYYTNTAGRVMTWDPSDSSLELDDDVHIAFGDDDDVEIYWNASNLIIMPLTDDTGAIIIGDGTNKSMDFLWYGSTAAKYVKFDLGSDKVTLEDIDLYLGDDDMLVFGDGADVTMKWDAAKLLIVPAAEFDLSMAVGHFNLKTTLDNKQIRINNRDYTQVSGDTIGFQTKPAQAATTTGDVFGAQISPRINESFGAGSLQGLGINCDLKGAAGGNVATLRGISVELESASGSTRTITDVMVIRGRNYLHGTVTNGPYMIQVDAAEGNVEWGAFAKLCDNGGPIADLATGVTGNPTGVIKVKIGDTVGYIPMYVGYTAA